MSRVFVMQSVLNTEINTIYSEALLKYSEPYFNITSELRSPHD